MAAPAAAETPAPPPTEATPIPPPTEAPTVPPPPTPTPPPSPTPTPFIVVAGDLVRARSGPATSFEQVGELKAGDQLALLGKNEDASWWLVCCLDGQEVWVTAELVAAQGPVEAVALAANIPPSPTPTDTPEPKPYAVVRNPRVNVRTGPSTDAPALGQADQGARLEIVGRNQAADWWQVCCVNGQPGWIIGELVLVEGPIEQVALAANLPTVTPQPVPSPTAVQTPPAVASPEPGAYPFALSESTAFPFPGKDYLRVGAKVRTSENTPQGGTYLRVRNETTGQEWLSRQSSSLTWDYSAPSADFDDFREINLQFDTNGQASLTGNDFLVWLVDGSGRQVSPAVRHQPADGELQWLYVEFTRQ